MLKSKKAAAAMRTAGATATAYPKVSQMVAADIRQKIAHGEYRHGGTLPPEAKLVEQYSVSRPTIREAVRILETEGLVVTSRGGSKGAKIQAFSSNHAARFAGLVLQVRGTPLIDVFRARTIIEPIAAREIAERRPRPDLSGLEAIHRKLEAASDNPREMARLLQEFDEELMNLHGNQALRLISQMIHHIIELHLSTIPNRLDALPPSLRDIKKRQAQLRHILQLLKEGAGAQVEKEMRKLLRHIEAAQLQLDAVGTQIRII